MYGEERFKDMLGRKLKSVELSNGGEEIVFKFKEGDPARFGVSGDCCSQSWIEHLEKPARLSGAVITEVDEPEMPPHDNHECEPCSGAEGSDYCYKEHEHDGCTHDYLQVYHTRFRTTKGDIVLEYRNNSNGYYGGSLDRLL